MSSTLASFRVANHLSFNEQQHLSLVADSGKELEASLLSARGERLSRVAAIYGGNATGKTSALRSLEFLRNAVVFSHREWPPDAGVPVKPFLLAKDPAPFSSFGVTVFIDSQRYDYDITLNGQRILSEELAVWPKSRRQLWFSREEDEFTFGKAFKGSNATIRRLVRPNSLFLSAAAQNNHADIMPLFAWFESIFFRDIGHSRIFTAPTEVLTYGREADYLLKNHGRMNDLLRAADLGIDGVELKETKTPDLGRHPFRSFELHMRHKGSARDVLLPFSEESSGTQSIFELGIRLISILELGGLAVVDELERSLHPSIAIEIVRMFQDPERNPLGAQLVFSTHDSGLLFSSSTERSPLRRDQVWFAEKVDGATTLRPLTDFYTRESENHERLYLSGRLGGVPDVIPIRLGTF